MKTILITGGNGNISKMIYNNLSSDYNITLLSRRDFDLISFNDVSNFFIDKEFDILIHTAINGGRRTKEENGDIVYQNMLMFENIMKFSRKFKLIINLDSGAIYDRSTDIFNRKEDELNSVPTDYYGFSKYLIYNRSLLYNNLINLRIFNIFHINEENDRFIKACFLAKKNGTNIKINEDKYFDFMYEDDFIKILRFYIENFQNDLPKTINLSYTKKYKLSEIAKKIIKDKGEFEVLDQNFNKNYCGNGTILSELCIGLDDLDESLKKYETRLGL